MITTTLNSSAIFSDDLKYRYLLTRQWNEKPSILFIMLNPSTADAEKFDPTVKRCYNFAHLWGYGELNVCNIFALRATNPKELKKCDDPIGKENDKIIIETARTSSLIVAAWGEHGTYKQRDLVVLSLICETLNREIFCLKTSKNGNPVHPLYLPGDSKPIIYHYEKVKLL